MEGNNTNTAAPAAPEPRVLSTSLSSAFQAGEAGNNAEKSAGFDDIFAPPDTDGGPENASEEAAPAAAEEKPSVPEVKEPPPAAGILEKLAAEYGLNPADPKHARLLAQMAAQQSAPAPEQKGEEQAQPEEDDEYEQLESALFAEEAPQQAQQQYPPQAALPPLQPGKFGDVLDDTNTQEEAMERWLDGWTLTEDGKVADPKKAGAVMNAFWIRQFAAMGMPVVHNIVRQTLQAEFGEALGYIRGMKESGRRQQLYSGVIERLSKQNGYEKLGDLFQPLSEKTVKVRKEVVNDTAFNRILAKDPWIMDIEKHDPDPDKALQKTHLARMQAVMRQWKKSQAAVPMADAKKLVESGAEIERKKQTDGARQRLNAGTGATGAGGTPDSDDAWLESIINSRGGRTMSVRDLLSK